MKKAPQSRGLFVDPQCPIVWEHPFSRRLVADYTILPNSGWRGGVTLRDLVRGGKSPRDGTLTNFAFDATDGWRGGGRPGGHGSLLFDGVNDYVYQATNSKFAFGTSAFSIQCWFKSGTTTLSEFISTYDDNIGAGNLYYVLRISNGSGPNTVNFQLSDPGMTSCSVYGAAAYDDNKWHHVVGTRNGTAICLYVDGSLVGSDTASGVYNFTLLGNVSFGALITGTSTPLQLLAGNLDGVQAHSRDLSASEVLQQYLEQKDGRPETLRWVGAKDYSFSTAGGGGGGVTSHNLCLLGTGA